MSKQPQHPPPDSEAAAEALDKTTRPEPSDDASTENDSFGPTPDGVEEDASPRDLKPRAIDRQFGSTPDIEPEGDLQEGADKWLEQSPEMNESFPDAKTG